MGSKIYPETSDHSYNITQRHKTKQLQHLVLSSLRIGSKRYPETSDHSYNITQCHKTKKLQHLVLSRLRIGSKRYPETTDHSYNIRQRHNPKQLQHQYILYITERCPCFNSPTTMGKPMCWLHQPLTLTFLLQSHPESMTCNIHGTTTNRIL